MLEGMTAQRCALGWREWLAAEWTIFRSTLRGLRRGRLASAAARRMRAVVWAVSPRDGHRHAFSVSRLTEAGYYGVAKARCSHPVPPGGLRSTMRLTGPLCLACSVLVGDLVTDAARGQSSLGTP
jgi:hypothetical protein